MHTPKTVLRSRAALCGLGCICAAVALAMVFLVPGSPQHAGAASTSQLVTASRQLAATSPVIPAAQSCASVASDTAWAGLPDYPTAIASATVVAAANGNPSYCDVKGMIAPQTHFELELPVSTWQGRYLQNGCGGYCGSVSAQSFPSCDATLGGDFAMATDDEGHTTAAGLGGSGLFAFNDQTLRDEYGYLSEHALAVVSKDIVAYYYGTKPSYSYYDGCSDGGREAMEEAERYPDDFNGIIAGAPEVYAGQLNAEAQTWFYKVNTDSNGDAILTDDKLPALHAAVMQACGGDDGVSGDGIITDPQNCHFDPASIQCPAGTDTTSCLTPAQVRVVRLYYQGPADPQGELLYPGGLPYGSELGWSVFELPPSQNGGLVPTTESLDYAGLSQPYLRYQLHAPGVLGPDPSQWQFTVADYNELYPATNTFDALSVNLSAFRAHGGKLLIWQGWADNAIMPSGTVDYYDQLTRAQGGLASTEQFARLFLFPTVYHCGGGYANSSFDVVYPMVQWVEQGAAPAQVTATDTISGTTLTRPVYPYPLVPI
jgi:feruloyl esterase